MNQVSHYSTAIRLNFPPSFIAHEPRQAIVFYQFLPETDKGEKNLTLRTLAKPRKAGQAGERLKKFFPNGCNNPK